MPFKTQLILSGFFEPISQKVSKKWAFSLVFSCHSKIRAFYNWVVFLHLNPRLVWYSLLTSIWKSNQIFTQQKCSSHLKTRLVLSFGTSLVFRYPLYCEVSEIVRGIAWNHLGQMLIGPVLIWLAHHLLVLLCNCWLYYINIGA